MEEDKVIVLIPIIGVFNQENAIDSTLWITSTLKELNEYNINIENNLHGNNTEVEFE